MGHPMLLGLKAPRAHVGYLPGGGGGEEGGGLQAQRWTYMFMSFLSSFLHLNWKTTL